MGANEEFKADLNFCSPWPGKTIENWVSRLMTSITISQTINSWRPFTSLHRQPQTCVLPSAAEATGALQRKGTASVLYSSGSLP